VVPGCDEPSGPLAAISLGLRRALWLGLRVADGLGQHLAKLSLGFRRLALKGFLPLGHRQYVGMPETKLNPIRRRINATSPQPVTTSPRSCAASDLYAGSLSPEFRVTASTLSSVINGIATIVLFVFIDPHLS
jgi:hypothetical protein